jgi:L-alanine-DL-glutamate epimerase-like enolase superfamily enzyme
MNEVVASADTHLGALYPNRIKYRWQERNRSSWCTPSVGEWTARYPFCAIDENGCVDIPEGPVLGVEYDWDFIIANQTSSRIIE